MASLIGPHMRSNGIKQYPCRAVLSLNGVGLGGDEQHPDTVTVLRDTRVFPNGETAPDFHTFQPGVITWEQYGRYWFKERTKQSELPDGSLGWRNHKEAWDVNPTHYRIIQNEQGGNDPWAIQRMVDIERAISWAAGADNYKCCVGNLAGGTPGDFELWKSIIAPFIIEAWELWGHVYGRHVYGQADKDAAGKDIPGTGNLVLPDGTPKPGQPARVIQELEYLQAAGYGGGVILTECGLEAGYGVVDYGRFEQQVLGWEAALRPYAESGLLIGLCWWETGGSEFNADYTAHLQQIEPKLYKGLPKWTPPAINPPNNGQGETVKITTEEQPIVLMRGFGGRTVKNLRFRVLYNNGESNVYAAWRGIDFSEFEELDIRGFEFHAPLEREIEVECEPENPNPPQAVIKFGDLGIDVSAHQGEFDWETAVTNGVTYAILRSSNGTGSATTDANGRDLQLKRNAAECIRLGVKWGIYHFLRPDHSLQGQIDLVHDILTELKMLGTYPTENAVFDDGTPFPIVWSDVERFDLTPGQIRQFYDAFTVAKGHYSRASIWDVIMAGVDPWWADDPLWCADYGANNGTIPNRAPIAPKKFKRVLLWQYSSSTGAPVGWPKGLDLNTAGPYVVGDTKPPEPPPTGEVYNTSFMRADAKAWRVIRRIDGSGEDVWDLPLDGDRFVRVKNEKEGEWYNKNLRERDTSPAPQPDGTERLYLLNGGAGGQIAPDEAMVGVTYSYTNQVQFKAKNNCANLTLNSGAAASTFLLKEVIPNYTFPGTGFQVDVLFWTVQTGENQLYAIKDGVRLGWVGGGAQQDNNIWGGELAELYLDRAIPQEEPPRYCD